MTFVLFEFLNIDRGCVVIPLCVAIPDPQRDRGPFDIDIQANSKLPYSGPAKLKIEVIEGQRLYIIDLYYMQRNRSQQIVRWQIDHLRGYGSSDSVLKIETGRWVS